MLYPFLNVLYLFLLFFFNVFGFDVIFYFMVCFVFIFLFFFLFIISFLFYDVFVGFSTFEFDSGYTFYNFNFSMVSKDYLFSLVIVSFFSIDGVLILCIMFNPCFISCHVFMFFLFLFNLFLFFIFGKC